MTFATTTEALSDMFFQRAIARAGHNTGMRRSFEISLLGSMLSAIIKSGPDLEVLVLTRPYSRHLDPALYVDLSNLDSQRILARNHMSDRLVYEDLFKDFETIFEEITPIIKERSAQSRPYSPLRDAAVIAGRSLSFIRGQKSLREGIHDSGLPALYYSNPYTRLTLATLLLREIVRQSRYDGPLSSLWMHESDNQIVADIEVFTDETMEKYPEELTPQQATLAQKIELLDEIAKIYETADRIIACHHKKTYANPDHIHGLMIVRELVGLYVDEHRAEPTNDTPATLLDIGTWSSLVMAKRQREEQRLCQPRDLT